mmetsp:Transcript_25713/g.73978  ORF Transcript_25713/g.73978 Transcript_25713/m.73978 type:complete len:335 (-) Transcript_25713:127-1131(-)
MAADLLPQGRDVPQGIGQRRAHSRPICDLPSGLRQLVAVFRAHLAHTLGDRPALRGLGVENALRGRLLAACQRGDLRHQRLRHGSQRCRSCGISVMELEQLRGTAGGLLDAVGVSPTLGQSSDLCLHPIHRRLQLAEARLHRGPERRHRRLRKLRLLADVRGQAQHFLVAALHEPAELGDGFLHTRRAAHCAVEHPSARLRLQCGNDLRERIDDADIVGTGGGLGGGLPGGDLGHAAGHCALHVLPDGAPQESELLLRFRPRLPHLLSDQRHDGVEPIRVAVEGRQDAFFAPQRRRPAQPLEACGRYRHVVPRTHGVPDRCRFSAYLGDLSGEP